MHVATLRANMKSHRKDHLIKNMKHASLLCSFVLLSHLRCSPWNSKSWIYTINNSLKEYWQNDSLQNRFGMTRIFRRNLCNIHIGNAFQRIFFQYWGLQTLFISKDFFYYYLKSFSKWEPGEIRVSVYFLICLLNFVTLHLLLVYALTLHWK